MFFIFILPDPRVSLADRQWMLRISLATGKMPAAFPSHHKGTVNFHLQIIWYLAGHASSLGADRRPHVRFTPESGQRVDMRACPVCAKSGQMRRSKDRRYSIASSARASTSTGMSGLTAVAVLRLTMSSELVGAGTEPLHSPAAQPIDRAA